MARPRISIPHAPFFLSEHTVKKKVSYSVKTETYMDKCPATPSPQAKHKGKPRPSEVGPASPPPYSP